MNKVLIGIAVAVVLLAGCRAGQDELNAVILERDQLQAQVDELEGDLQEAILLSEDLDEKNSELTDASTELEESNANLLDSMISGLRDEIESLEDSLMCSYDPPHINYSSQDIVASGLQVFVEDHLGNVRRNEWNILRGNAYLSKHTLFMNDGISLEFLVSFDEPDFGWNNGVFFINEACWLDI
jgi:predicted nuclease with TOPRIM domain